MIHCLLQLASFAQEFVTSRLPGWCSGKESTCQFRRHGFDPWVGKIPWRRKWQPTPVFLSGKSHGQRSLVGYSPQRCKELDITQPLNNNKKKTEKGKVFYKYETLALLCNYNTFLSVFSQFPNTVNSVYSEQSCSGFFLESLWSYSFQCPVKTHMPLAGTKEVTRE